MDLLADWISLPDGDEELSDTQAIDAVVFPYHSFANSIQIQRTHQVQAATTAAGLDRFCWFPL